jgi:hypothetical protein
MSQALLWNPRALTYNSKQRGSLESSVSDRREQFDHAGISTRDF